MSRVITADDLRLLLGEVRIHDIKLAKALGYVRLPNIRKLIKRIEKTTPSAGTFLKVKDGAETQYYLTKKQVTYVLTHSRSSKAVEVTIQVLKAFDQFKKE